MVTKECGICKTVYQAKDRKGMEAHFAYRTARRSTFTHKCRVCKRKYDKERSARAVKSERDKYRNFIRAETKKIIKSKYRCSVIDCGKPAEIHHFDYTKPAEVLPVCRVHHAAIHRLNGLIEGYLPNRGTP